MRRFLALAALVSAVLGGAALVARSVPRAPSAARPPRGVELGPGSFDHPLVQVPEGVAWVAIGGGAEPETSQVQIEQDVDLATRTFAGRGVVLFGPGRGPFAVREAAAPARYDDPVLGALAGLFDARDRGARYRPTRLSPDGPATRSQVERVLGQALARGEGPLLVFVAAHGDQGETPLDNDVLLWGGTSFTVRDLVASITALPLARPARFVITSCYAGGFADLAVDHEGEPAPGPEQCGLFATSWDRVASGCDPDPDRSAQEGYGIHLLHALRGRARDGSSLSREVLDLDGDGRTSLLEAHTFARIASRSFDVPTTTSERFAEAALAARGVDADGFDRAPSPEEERVIAALGAELDASDERIARAMLDRLASELDEKDDELAEAEAMRDEAFRELRVRLLERWPVLDDPFHPRFRATVDANREAILALLERSPSAAAHRRLEERAAALGAELDTLDVAFARAARLVSAYAHEHARAALRATDAAAYERYERLRACERWVPPVR